MLNNEFMRNAGFAVPTDFDPWTQVAPVDTSAVDGCDLIIRMGDFPSAGEAAEILLWTWAERALYDVSGIDAKQALDILFLSVVTVALRDEHFDGGGAGPMTVFQGQLLRQGAPQRFDDYCVRIDGMFVMAMLADQFDESVAAGGPLRAAVRRRRREGARRQRA